MVEPIAPVVPAIQPIKPVKPPPVKFAERAEWWKNQQNVLAELPPYKSPTMQLEEALQSNDWTITNNPISRWIVGAPPRSPGQEKTDLRKQQEYVRDGGAQAEKAGWFTSFYASLPMLVSTGRVTSVDDYLEIDAPLTGLSEAEMIEARQAFESVDTGEYQPEIPDWLEVPPEKKEAITRFLAGPAPLTPPNSVQKLTVNAILKSISKPQAVLPPDMTIEEVLRYQTLLGLPEGSLADVIDIDQIVTVLSEAGLERKAMIEDVLSGVSEWEVPDRDFWGKAFFAIQSPMQGFANFLQPYMTHVGDPWVGSAMMLVSKLMGDTWELDKFYDEARAKGVDPWHAAGQAFEEWSIPWYMKLPIAIVADPITYTPGIGLSIPAKILGKVGLRTFGRSLNSINKGMWYVTDVPFDWGKHHLNNVLLKSTSQIIKKDVETFSLVLDQAIGIHSGKTKGKFAMADVETTLRDSIKAYAATPNLDNNVLVDLGRFLSEHIALDENKIYQWSKLHGGKLTLDMESAVVNEVNQIITDMAGKVGSKMFNAKRMANALQIVVGDDTSYAAILAKLVIEIPAFSRKLSVDAVEAAIKVGRASTVNKVTNTLDNILARQKKIIASQQAGKQHSGGVLEGIALGLQRKVDTLENVRWRRVLERYTIKPFAEANLGSVSYPIWNALEGIGVSIAEGVIPRFVKLESYRMMTDGLIGDFNLGAASAGDVAGMFGSAPSHAAGAWTLLPGKIPDRILWMKTPKFFAGKDFLEWTGRRWVQISDVAGNGIKRNYVTQKMAQHFAEMVYTHERGDLIKTLGRLAKNPPKISKTTLGLTQHELEQDMFRRLLSGVDRVLEAKSVYTDGSLMSGEVLKLVRKSELLSPRAKAIAEDMIENGEVLSGKVRPDVLEADVGLGERVATKEELDALEQKLAAKAEELNSAYDAEKLIGETVNAKKNLIISFNRRNEIKEILTNLGENTPVPYDIVGPGDPLNVGDLVDSWFYNVDNGSLQAIGKTAERSPEYTAAIQAILREEYPSGYIRIFRGSGSAKRHGQEGLNREFTNVTSSKEIAVDFEDTWSTYATIDFGKKVDAWIPDEAAQKQIDSAIKEWGDFGWKIDDALIQRAKEEVYGKLFGVADPSINNVLVKIEDVLAIASVDESELIIRADVLKRYMETPQSPINDVGIEEFTSRIFKATIEDLQQYPIEIGNSFRFTADTISNTTIANKQSLMEIFSHFEVMSESAAYIPHRLMSQVMDETDILYKANKFGSAKGLWEKGRRDLLKTMDDVNTSMERVKAKLLDNVDYLTPKQKAAMEAVLERSQASNYVREAAIHTDAALMDDFWALPRALRTPEEHQSLRTARRELWATYQIDSAIPSAGEFVTRKNLAELYHGLPAQKSKPVNAMDRPLTSQDVASLFGTNIDGVATGLLDNIAMNGKPYFIQLVKQSADAKPAIFKGFTEEKIGTVYDNLLAQAQMDPEKDILIQKILLQGDGMRRELTSLKMRHSLSPDEKKAMDAWIDTAAEGRRGLIGDAPEPIVVPLENIKWSGIAPEDQAKIEALLNKLPTQVTSKIKSVNLEPLIDPTMLATSRELGSIGVGSPAAINNRTIYHEAAHLVFDDTMKNKWLTVLDNSVGWDLEESFSEAFALWVRDPNTFGTAKLFKVSLEHFRSQAGFDEAAPRMKQLFEAEFAAKPVVTPVQEAAKPTPLISATDWNIMRQEALDLANKDYYKAFADYSNENMLAATMKMIYPYWNYHQYRWFELSRQALRHPGIPAAWGKYQDYSENGFVPTPIPNIEANPFIGSMVGTTMTLTRQDFASYYDKLGVSGEVLDYTQRWGYYPNALVTGAVALTPMLSGRDPELGSILPPINKTGINLLAASNIPGVAKAATWLKDKIFHENFHEYYTTTILDNMQIEAGGTLIEGQTGTDLWFKKLRGEDFKPAEQELWDTAYDEASILGAIRSQFPQFRLKTEEYKEAYGNVTKIFEEQLGMTEAFQKELFTQHQRPTDVVGGLPPATLAALDELWEWKIFFGRGTILNPPDVADLKGLMDKYRKRVKSYQTDRLGAQAIADNGFINPNPLGAHLTGREWRSQYAGNWRDYASKVDSLDTEAEFADAIEAFTPEGEIAMAKRLNFSVTPTGPIEEAINLYFQIELTQAVDPYNGELEDDFLTFWLKREAVRMALTEEQRDDFDTYIRRYQTPMELTFHKAYNTYIRGYKSADRILFGQQSEADKLLIKEYYAVGTTLERKDEIKSYTNDTGQIISQYNTQRSNANSAMRELSPTLDFWLYIFGYVSAPKTPEARSMISTWEADKASILITRR